MKTLVLNKDYQPINIISARKAFVDYWCGKVQIVEAYENKFFYTIDNEFPVPSIVRLEKWARVVYRQVPLTKRNLYIRDRYICGYSGKRLTDPKERTWDHIIPRSKGGKHSWDNLVTCDRKINEAKSDFILGKDPEVDHLKRPKTGRPHYLVIMQNGIRDMPEAWKPYLYL